MVLETHRYSKDEVVHERISTKIQAAVVDTLYRHTFLLQLANLFIALATADILHQYLPLWMVLSWFLSLAGVSLSRLYLLYRYRRDQTRQSHPHRWLIRFRYGSMVSGLLLALTSLALLYSPDLNLMYILLLIVVGMMAGAVSSLSVELVAFRSYFFILSVPYLLVMFSLAAGSGVHKELFFSIALMLLAYTVVMYFFADSIHRGTLQGIEHRFQHEAMAETLAEEIEKRAEAQEELMLSARIIANIREGVVVTDRKNRIIRVNATFSRITGYAEEDVLGKTPGVLSSGKQGQEFYTSMWDTLNRCDAWEGEIWNRRKNGEVYPEWLSITAIRGSDGEVGNYVGWFRDITERKREEERLSYLAHYDVLTGLPNRKLFTEQLDIALATCVERNELLGILFLDLNMFKQVNDSFGHDVGDILLREVALRLKSVVRGEDVVARLGGDEFVILLRQLDDYHDIEVVAEKLVEVASDGFVINGCHCKVGFAIGISLAPLHALDRKNLLRCADRAMYQAKRDRSHSHWHVFELADGPGRLAE